MNRRTSLGPTIRTLPIASVAMSCEPDPAANLQRIAACVTRIKAEHPHVRLVHFGETILGWYFKKGETAAYHARIAEPIPGPAVDRLAAVAREHAVYLSFGMTERAGDAIHNSQVLLSPSGEVRAVHRKVCQTAPVFAAGDRPITVAEVDGVRVVLLICADVQDFRVVRAIRRARADLVLASLADYGTDLRLARMIGCLLDTPAVTANRTGREGATSWPGMIVSVDRCGRVRQHAVGGEHVLVERFRFGADRAAARLARRVVGGGRIVCLSAAMIGGGVARAVAGRLHRKPATTSS